METIGSLGYSRQVCGPKLHRHLHTWKPSGVAYLTRLLMPIALHISRSLSLHIQIIQQRGNFEDSRNASIGRQVTHQVIERRSLLTFAKLNVITALH